MGEIYFEPITPERMKDYSQKVKELDKLIDRFNAPADAIPASQRNVVSMRVGVLLKYWIEQQFDEFDDDVIRRLQDFVSETMQANKGLSTLAAGLLSEIARKQADRKKRSRYLEVPSIDMPPSDSVIQVGSPLKSSS